MTSNCDQLRTLDAGAVRRWSRAAADALGQVHGEINALNVFPVPDSDTGTNLHLTMLAAVEAAESVEAESGAGEVWLALAHGSLLGARGNSGVILSQLLRGLAAAFTDEATAESGGAAALREGLSRAADLAYAAVGRPVEGTILTVARAAGEAADGLDDGVRDELAATARAAAGGARAALAHTTEQLDALARGGVVDAGGAGLCVVLDELAAVACGDDGYHGAAGRTVVPPPSRGTLPAAAENAAHSEYAEPVGQGGISGPGYEVMYLLDTDGSDTDATVIPRLRGRLDALGDSLVVVGGDGLWNVHVHVDDAGAAVEAGLEAGRPYRIRVTYLHAPDGRARGRGVTAVVAGDELAALFESAGATVVHHPPGDTLSLADLLDGLRRAGDEVVLLPNEATITPLAEAAAERARDEGIHVSVVPARAPVQGLAALAVHDEHRRFGDDVIAMTSAAGATRFGEVTMATRTAVTSAGICHVGDALGLIDGDVAVIADGVSAAAAGIIERMLSGGGELVTLITGDTGDGVEAGLGERLVEHLHHTRPEVDVMVYEGGACGSPLLVGVE